MGNSIYTRFTLARAGFAVLLLGTLAACGGTETPLPGERLSIRGADVTAVANRSAAISLPRAVSNADWSALNGAADHSIGHVAFDPAASLRWSADVGRGVGRDYRITSGPVAADGRVFVLDGAGRVSAVSPEGAVLWTLDTTPAGEKPADGSGGGLSLANGVLYAGTGFGEVIAVDPVSGGIHWRRQMQAPLLSAPVSDGRNVYFVTRDDVAYALGAKDGSLEWMQRGAAALDGFGGGASPAIRSGQVVLPFSSGDVMMVRANSGQPKWNAPLDGGRQASAINRIGDISGDPVIDGNRLYVASIAGQTVRMNLQSGKRDWSLPVGAVGPVWPAGGSVFLVSDDARMMRVNAANGQVIWAQQMAQYTNPDKRKGLIRYYGPVLAGGLLWVADREGGLRGYSPTDGSVAARLDVPGGAAAAPIVMAGVMYVQTLDGKLLAFQ